MPENDISSLTDLPFYHAVLTPKKFFFKEQMLPKPPLSISVLPKPLMWQNQPGNGSDFNMFK